MKECLECFRILTEDLFAVKSKKTGKLTPYCKPCYSKRIQIWKKKKKAALALAARNSFVPGKWIKAEALVNNASTVDTSAHEC